MIKFFCTKIISKSLTFDVQVFEPLVFILFKKYFLIIILFEGETKSSIHWFIFQKCLPYVRLGQCKAGNLPHPMWVASSNPDCFTAHPAPLKVCLNHVASACLIYHFVLKMYTHYCGMIMLYTTFSGITTWFSVKAAQFYIFTSNFFGGGGSLLFLLPAKPIF